MTPRVRVKTALSFDSEVADPDDDAAARGLVFEDTSGIKKANPAHRAAHQHKQRTREIAEALSLWAGFQ